jgi:hypothetical protein
MRSRPLLYAALAVLLMQVLHTLDHILVQDRGLGPLATEVTLVGYVGFAVNLALLYLVLRGDALAPLAGLAFGLSVIAGGVAVHLLPHWSAFSDPYRDLSVVEAATWISVYALIASGALLALVAARELRAAITSRPAAT